MPHLTLEYTDNITVPTDFRALFSSLHSILSEVGGIKIGNCKSRAVKLANYHIGDGGAPSAFVHLDVAFLEGRPADLKREIGRRLLRVLEEHYALPPSVSPSTPALQITLEIRDISRDFYFKFPEGTL